MFGGPYTIRGPKLVWGGRGGSPLHSSFPNINRFFLSVVSFCLSCFLSVFAFLCSSFFLLSRFLLFLLSFRLALFNMRSIISLATRCFCRVLLLSLCLALFRFLLFGFTRCFFD